MKYFQIRALVTRYMVPLDIMNDPKKGKPMISFRKSLQSKPPVTILKLAQIVRPLQSLLPASTAAETATAAPAKTIFTTKEAVKEKKTKAPRPKQLGVNARKNARSPKKK
jgi:hypothetical protein